MPDKLPRPQVSLVGELHDGDPLDYLLSADVPLRLGNAHAIFQRAVEALKAVGAGVKGIDRFTHEALGVSTYADIDSDDYPRLLQENYERLVRTTARWVRIR